MNHKDLHQKAKKVADSYKLCERELVSILSLVDQRKTFYQFGFNSLFSYMTKELGLSEATACNISAVIRKSYQVPQLKEKVVAGEISLSKARKITPVINKENQDLWIQTAQSKTQKQIERDVALAHPQSAIPEKLTYIPIHKNVGEKVFVKHNISRLKLELGLSEKLMLDLRRCQDLESQRQKQPVDLESCLTSLISQYLEKHDPIKKAERQKARGKLEGLGKTDSGDINQIDKLKPKVNSPLRRSDTLSREEISHNAQASVSDRVSLAKNHFKREPIPSHIKHQVQLRDQSRCTYRDKQGHRCQSRRHLEYHHIIPVAEGGENHVDNLQLLCSGHHRAIHSRS